MKAAADVRVGQEDRSRSGSPGGAAAKSLFWLNKPVWIGH